MGSRTHQFFRWGIQPRLYRVCIFPNTNLGGSTDSFQCGAVGDMTALIMVGLEEELGYPGLGVDPSQTYVIMIRM